MTVYLVIVDYGYDGREVVAIYRDKAAAEARAQREDADDRDPGPKIGDHLVEAHRVL